MVVQSTGIGALPNEKILTDQILLSVFSHLSTRELLPITPSCHLFHDVILRILELRLREAAANPNHKLILECYHPSAKFYNPYLYCEYLGTPGLSPHDHCVWGEEGVGSLGKLSNLYSYFRPLKPDANRRALRLHPAVSPAGAVNPDEQLVCQDINLESHELFSQLVTVTNLVKLGPKPGIFKSSVNIGQGLTRVWRDWLSDRVTCENEDPQEREKRILWSDARNNVGMRMQVEPGPEVPPAPVFGRDEDPSVSYTLQYEGELYCETLDDLWLIYEIELAVRSSQLLLALEQSLGQETNHTGKSSVVISSWGN
ncbi:hypothetical protein LAWI1_G001768 [Lachnellula willkommii]|uniref:F-box domain-containing protein n=1 Tax=Lachnellula willkommii TaxID=215461 RepID=A0A559MLT4_9HELO|nr:hypothetical protein LAWI1_G001768 [Lachnellula willkommii]